MGQVDLKWRLTRVGRKICPGIPAGRPRIARMTIDAFFHAVLLTGLSLLFGTEERTQLLLAVTWPVPENLSSLFPLHHSINQPVHCSDRRFAAASALQLVLITC